MTTEVWWTIVRSNRTQLCELVTNYHPWTVHRPFPVGPVTAHQAEIACGVIRGLIAGAEQEMNSPAFRLNQAIDSHNAAEIISLLESTWFGVPESKSAWSIPGFSLACDLMDDLPDELTNQPESNA